MCNWFWEGGESLLAQVRGGKSEHHRARCRITPVQPGIHAGGDGVSRPDGECHREYTASVAQAMLVRVKRWCKRPPREAQATRHGKPHRVQGQIGNRGTARSVSAKADRFRVSAAETNDSLPRRNSGQTEIGLQLFQNQFQNSGDVLPRRGTKSGKNKNCSSTG